MVVALRVMILAAQNPLRKAELFVLFGVTGVRFRSLQEIEV
jgi:hypothetical protein